MAPPTALGPVIALLTQPGQGANSSQVPASYVKWLEAAGARVVHLPYHATNQQVDSLFTKVNGALMPGGDGDVPPAARRIYALANDAYHNHNDPFPIWGTCDGFEWLMQIAADDDTVLTPGWDAENISLPLHFTPAAERSALLAEAKATPVMSERISVFGALATRNITMNNHQQGVSPADFAARPALADAFEILATNEDRRGRKFVSMVEGKKLPVWATQFHPEKPVFEQGQVVPGGWPYEAIRHDRAAIAASQLMANYFVDAARRLSSHRWADAASLVGSLMYNFETSTSGSPAFVQSYFFQG